jgi:hypothetical protein
MGAQICFLVLSLKYPFFTNDKSCQKHHFFALVPKVKDGVFIFENNLIKSMVE